MPPEIQPLKVKFHSKSINEDQDARQFHADLNMISTCKHIIATTRDLNYASNTQCTNSVAYKQTEQAHNASKIWFRTPYTLSAGWCDALPFQRSCCGPLVM